MSSIAVDWGSSSFRAYLLDEQMHCIDRVNNANGVLNLKISFADALKTSCAQWMQTHQIKRIIMGGMIGSRNGWFETAYSHCPVSASDHRQQAHELETEFDLRVEILQGVQGHSPCGFPDVMRGEEIQLFGALDNFESASAMVCLPGTHSKWVQMHNDRIDSFATLMTGELFALVREHSSIGTLVKDETFDQASFLQGVSDLQNGLKKSNTGLLHSLFSVRARAVSNTLTAASIFSYLSGLMIADEISSAKEMFDLQQDLVLITDEKLKAPYELALHTFSLTPLMVDSEAAFLSGIRRLIN